MNLQKFGGKTHSFKGWDEPPTWGMGLRLRSAYQAWGMGKATNAQYPRNATPQREWDELKK